MVANKKVAPMDELNRNELEVLRLLWNRSPQKPAEILGDFSWDIDNGTLRSVLVAMVDQGLLKRERAGRAFFYSPRVRRETQLKRVMGRMADVFAGGSTGQLLMSLVENEKLSAEERQKLREIADGDE